MSNVLINHRKINDGIVSTPGNNVGVWYTREASEKFSINGSFNGLETPYDWVLVKETDSKWVKSGIISFNTDRKSVVIQFTSPFVNEDYYVFFLSDNNTNLYWSSKKKNQFVVNGSFTIGSELSWLAIHKKIGQQTGLRTPGSLYTGQRILAVDKVQWNGSSFIPGDDPLNESTLPMPADATNSVAIPPLPATPFCGTYDAAVNLNGWYKNELIIKPTSLLDGISSNNTMDFDSIEDYSIILSSDTNINTYWSDKRADRVKINTSYPTQCIINYLIIKTGLNWWDEI
jgi:hypothetical protein